MAVETTLFWELYSAHSFWIKYIVTNKQMFRTNMDAIITLFIELLLFLYFYIFSYLLYLWHYPDIFDRIHEANNLI